MRCKCQLCALHCLRAQATIATNCCSHTGRCACVCNSSVISMIFRKYWAPKFGIHFKNQSTDVQVMSNTVAGLHCLVQTGHGNPFVMVWRQLTGLPHACSITKTIFKPSKAWYHWTSPCARCNIFSAARQSYRWIQSGSQVCPKRCCDNSTAAKQQGSPCVHHPM